MNIQTQSFSHGSPEWAAQQLLRRRRARANLTDYTRFTYPAFRPGEPHLRIAEKLEAVERGEIKRLMIEAPPRHGKSEQASRRFPAWFIGKHPTLSVIAASYNSDLAGDFGREVRNIMQTPEHLALFPNSQLAQDSQAQNRWHTQNGGGYAAAGVGTAVTGRGAHVFLIDDPFKDREDADSEVKRERVYRWYLSTAYTRLEGALVDDIEDPLWRDWTEAAEQGEPFDGAIVIINTRWHDADLSGRLQEDMANGGDQWDILTLPAISDGQALWPEKYPLERLNQIKAALTPREWNSLYQQQPTPEEGTYFNRDWFRMVDKAPRNIAKYIMGDFAVTEGGGDFTSFGVWGLEADEGATAIDWWRDQTTANVWIEALIDLMQKHKPRAFFGESGVIRRAVEPLLRQRMKERKVYCRLVWLPRVSDKAASARGFQARAENGQVAFVNSQWAQDVVEQLISFPTGKRDDDVDVCSLLGMALDQTHPAITLPEGTADGKPDPYDIEEDGINWKTV